MYAAKPRKLDFNLDFESRKPETSLKTLTNDIGRNEQNASGRELGKQANLDFKFWFLQEKAPDHDGNLNCASDQAVSVAENKLFRFPVDFI